MIESDLTRIEQALAVRLPSDYRHLLLHFPIRYDAGTCDGPLWDNADALINRNQELRTARRSFGVDYQPLPGHFFFIGDDGAGWQFLIDLREEPSIVHIMEFESIEAIGPAQDDAGKSQNLNEWFHAHLLDLKNEGIDITSDTPPNQDTGWGCIIGMIGFCLIAAIVIALMVAGIQWLTGR